MSGYTRNNPVHEVGVDSAGTRTAEISQLGDIDFNDPKNRMPAFVGLAKATGGFYAENENGMTLAAAMDAARMNYDVRFQENFTITTMDDNGTTSVSYPHRGTYGIWPDGTTVGLGMVKSVYQVVQPAESGMLGQHVMDESDASVVAAGIYGDPVGAKSYVAFKLPDGITIGGADRHDLYLAILNSYDGSSNIRGLLAPIRLDCTNMATITFGRVANRFSFRHSGDIEDKLEKAREALGLASEWTAEYKKAAERLLATELRGPALDRFLKRVLPTPEDAASQQAEKNWSRKRFEMKQIITQSDTCEFGRGTAYAALQGVQEWADWVRPTKRTGDAGAISRFARILDGGETEELKLRAARLLIAVH